MKYHEALNVSPSVLVQAFATMVEAGEDVGVDGLVDRLVCHAWYSVGAPSYPRGISSAEHP